MKTFTRRRLFTHASLILLTLLFILPPPTITDTHARLAPGDLVVMDPLGGGKFVGALYSISERLGNRAILSSFDSTAQGFRLFTGDHITVAPTGHLYLSASRRLLSVNPFNGFRKLLSNLDEPRQGTGTDSTFPDTLEPKATTGTGVEFEASDDIFLESDVGSLLISGESVAVITSVTRAAVVVADILVPFPDTEPIAPNNWFLRGVLRGTFEGLAVRADGQIYATVPNDKLLLLVDPVTGIRTQISRLGDLSEGETLQRGHRVLIEESGDTLLLLDIGQDKIVRLDLRTGVRTLLSRFGDDSQGPTGINVSDFALEESGDIIVTERFNRQLMRVDPDTGFREVVSDFNDLAQGPKGRVLEGVTINQEGRIFVVDSQAGGELLVNGAVFEVFPDGTREIVSNFGDNTEGPEGFKPTAITVAKPISPTPEDAMLVDTVLLAEENVEIGKGALVTSGNVLTNMDKLEAKVTLNKKARTAQGFQFWGNVVVIGKGATVGGDVLWNQRINNQGQILGDEIRSPDFPIFDALLPIRRAVTGDANILITKNGFLSLPPGRFKSITVLKKALLIFEGGVYEVETLTVGKGATVIYDQSTEIHASKGVSFGKKSNFRPPSGSSLDAKAAWIYTEGNFDAGKGSAIQAQIIAPFGTVKFGKSARFVGYAQARNIVLGKGAVTVLNNALEDSLVPTP